MPISGGGGDINFGVRITADNQVFVDGVRASNEEVKKLGEGLKKVAGDAKEAEKGQESLTAAITKGNIASDLAIKAFDKLTQVYAEMKEQTRQAQQESLRLDSVLRATHESAGRTAAQITELANAMAKVTAFDDDKVKRAAAQLASFGDIVGATFDRTIRLAADMSAVFGGDLISNTQRLAKALTDPGEALGQLERTFGRFDPEVKRSVKSALELNDVMAAQGVILDAVAGRVEGAATNAYRGLERQIEGTKKAYDDLLKAIGSEVFEAKSKEASVFEKALNSMADNFISRVQTIKGLFESGTWLARMSSYAALLRGDVGTAIALSNAADRIDANPAGEGPTGAPPKSADPNRERAANEFQRLLEGSSKAEKFASEWRHAWATIIQDGKVGTAEAQQIINGIIEKYAKVPAAAAKAVGATKEAALADAHVTAQVKHLEEQDRIYQSILRDLEGVVRASETHAKSLGMGRTEAQFLRRETELIAKEEEKIKKLDPERQAAAREQLKIAVERLRTERDMTIELEYQAKAVESFNREAAVQGQNQASLYDDLSNRVASIAVGISRWKDELRNFVRELIAIMAKRWVLNIAAMATGNGALSAQAAQLGQSTVTGAAGNWLSSGVGTAASWAGDGIASLAGYSAFGGFGEMSAGYIAQSAFLTGAAESAPAFGTLAGEIGAAIANIPVWGWIVAAIIAVAIAVGGRGGGPKVGGSFNGAFDAQGNFIGDVPVAGSDNGRFFTPNQADSAVAKLGRQTAAGYYQMLDRFHGSSAGVQFGLGFDQDPNGTAGARISSSVVVGGQKVFGSQDRGVDKDSDKFNEELALETKRMILAALQASDLPEAVQAIIGTVTAATATATQIDQIMQLAEAFTVLSDSLGDFDMDKILAQAGRTSKQVFMDQGKALSDLASKSTLTTASLQTLTAATGQYKEMAAQLILGLEQAKLSINEMFGQTARNIQLASLDGQGQYNFYQTEAERLFAQIGTSNSAEEVQRLAARIDQNYNAAFNLLSPEQQRAMGDEYLKRIDATNKAIQERLTKLQDQANKEAKDKLDEIKKVIDKLATDQQTAADTQLEAAQLNAVTARSGTRIEIVDSRGNTLAIVNGG